MEKNIVVIFIGKLVKTIISIISMLMTIDLENIVISSKRGILE